MVLVDTSIWVNHLRSHNQGLADLLNKTEVITHPFVIGELACGNLKNRATILSLLNELPLATLALHEEVLEMIEQKKLMGHGIGWIDAHLLASALISGTPLWTSDKNLRSLSILLDVLY